MTEKLPMVLIVDDEPYIRRTLADAFEDIDTDVRSAPGGEEGLAILERFEADLCIVDMRLPKMTGNAFIAEALGIRPHLRFIIHTGATDYSLPRELTRLGICRRQVFIKPVPDLDTLLAAAIDLYNRK